MKKIKMIELKQTIHGELSAIDLNKDSSDILIDTAVKMLKYVIKDADDLSVLDKASIEELKILYDKYYNVADEYRYYLIDNKLGNNNDTAILTECEKLRGDIVDLLQKLDEENKCTVINNKYTNEAIILNPLYTALYDFIIGCEKMQVQNNSELLINYNRAKNYFRVYNPTAYHILIN